MQFKIEYKIYAYVYHIYRWIMSKYVLKNDHPLIPREQTFSVNRKLITVHSEDRDINKWPNANHFELQLPQTYTNVETIALVEYSFPTYYYTFSNESQNTQITFIATISGHGQTNPITITISPGFYSPTQLAAEMQNQLNLAIRALSPSLATYDKFRVFYDEVRQRFLFGNTSDPFTFFYNEPYAPPKNSDYQYYRTDANAYKSEPCYAPCIAAATAASSAQPSATIRWNQYTNWGLGYNLGFVKCLPSECGNPNDVVNANKATAIPVTSSQSVYYRNPSPPTTGYEWLTVSGTGYVLVPPNPPSLNGASDMYIEIDKYNYMDEMQPYSTHTSNNRNNDYNGIVNSAFAKIPLRTKPTKIVSALEYMYGDEPQDTCQGFATFFPPLDKLSKLKFKFRYHDGTLVDFGGQNFSFTIALYMYRDEIARSKQLRAPFVLSS
jgi:hypothetical protein